jgi:hypothetical protein
MGLSYLQVPGGDNHLRARASRPKHKAHRKLISPAPNGVAGWSSSSSPTVGSPVSDPLPARKGYRPSRPKSLGRCRECGPRISCKCAAGAERLRRFPQLIHPYIAHRDSLRLAHGSWSPINLVELVNNSPPIVWSANGPAPHHHPHRPLDPRSLAPRRRVPECTPGRSAAAAAGGRTRAPRERRPHRTSRALSRTGSITAAQPQGTHAYPPNPTVLTSGVRG